MRELDNADSQRPHRPLVKNPRNTLFSKQPPLLILRLLKTQESLIHAERIQRTFPPRSLALKEKELGPEAQKGQTGNSTKDWRRGGAKTQALPANGTFLTNSCPGEYLSSCC